MFAIDRAGLVGADGATHVGAYDFCYLRCVPNMIVMTPKDELECREMLNTALECSGPVAVRYPRGSGPGASLESSDTSKSLEIGKAEICRKIIKSEEKNHVLKIAFLAFGSMVYPCMKAAESLNATVVNMRFVKPIDKIMLKNILNDHDLIVSVEEHVKMGGAGSACLEAMTIVKSGFDKEVNFLQLGLPDNNIDHGDCETLLKRAGLDSDGIKKSVNEFSKIYRKINP